MDVLNGLIPLWRRQRLERSNADKILCKTPGFLVYAHLGNDGSGQSTAEIYDGESTNEDRIIDLRAPSYGSDTFSPSLPLPFKRGLYLKVKSDKSIVTTVFITHRE